MSDRPVPLRVYLDTSVVVGAVITGTKNSASCTAFCQRLIEANSQVFFSEILLLEYSEAVRRLATIPGQIPPALRLSFQLDQWERSLFVRQRWMTHGVQQFESLMARFAETFVLPFRRPTWLASTRVMANEQLRSHDAVHVATAREHGLRHLASSDAHFAKLRDLEFRMIRDDDPS